MNSSEFSKALKTLRLPQADAAVLLRTTARSVRRWQSGEQAIPATVVPVIDAWLTLHEAKMPWSADIGSILRRDDQQLKAHQEHAVQLASIRKRVNARKGPSVRWKVDLKQHIATFGQISVSFYGLLNGSFSLAYYSRRDGEGLDIERDRQLIEDAVYCIQEAVAAADKDWFKQ